MEGPSAKEIATLTERLSNTVQALGDLEKKMDSMLTAISEVVSLRRDLSALALQFESTKTRLFTRADDHELKIVNIDKSMAVNRKLGQIATALAISLLGGSGGLVAWLYTRVENSNRLEWRVETIESWAAQAHSPSLVVPLEPQKPTKGKP